MKAFLMLFLTLTAGSLCNAQLGDLLGSVGNIVNNAVNVATNTENSAVNLATSVAADRGFNTGWWVDDNIKVYNVAVANAQICTQGCTDDIYNSIVQVRNDAVNAGTGSNFDRVIVQEQIVGPGVYHCYRRDYGPVYYDPARSFAIDNGYVF